MKKGLLNQIAEDYWALLPNAQEWTRKGAECMRRSGEWVQILGFNASRFDDRYIPRCALQFLWIAGPASGSFVPQELKTDKGAQRWISKGEHADRREKIFAAMLDQFKPRIDGPLKSEEVVLLLQQDASSYWPHAYALAIVEARAGRREAAALRLQEVRARADFASNAHIRDRSIELAALLEARDSQEMQLHLEAAERAMLDSLHLKEDGSLREPSS